MAYLRPNDAAKVVAWCDANIPGEALAADGYEREVHVTVLYGFNDDAETLPELEAFLADYGPVSAHLGTISRFENEEDVLKIGVHSEDLATLHYALREFFGDRVEVTHPEYQAHLTLAYVKSGALPELNGDARFEGMTCVFDSLVYSAPDSKKKTVIPLVPEAEGALTVGLV